MSWTFPDEILENSVENGVLFALYHIGANVNSVRLEFLNSLMSDVKTWHHEMKERPRAASVVTDININLANVLRMTGSRDTRSKHSKKEGIS